MQIVSSAFLLLVVELSCGRLVLAGGPTAIPRAVQAVSAWGDISATGASASLIADALPPYATREFWIGRNAAVYECAPGATALTSARQVFSGIIAEEPSQAGGILSISLITPEQRPQQLPAGPAIDATRYPSAPADTLGKLPPKVWGEVADAPLLPIVSQPRTTLAATVAAGDTSLALDDATVLAAAGNVWVDGLEYAYTSRSDTVLYGLAPAARRDHRQGTLVAQVGDTVYLAAGHPVTSLGQIKADGVILGNAVIDAAASTVTLSGPPALAARGERMTLQAHFDQIVTGTTASNPANAIRAAINTYTQSAGTLPSGVTAATDPAAEIIFTRPADGNRIIGGTYTVGFSVSGQSAQVGRAEVTIGGQVVYVYEPGTGALYSHNPASFILDTDTDRLPVEVKVADGGNASLSIAITSASRIVVTGNLDEANYATIAPGKVLKVKQTDAMADRGPIARAQLLCRWFATAAGLGSASVKVNGATVGALKQTQLADATLTKNITVDVTSQGQAALPQLDVVTSVSGGTASLSHNTQALQSTVTAALQQYKNISGLYYWRGWSLAPTLMGWSSGLGSITVEFVFSVDEATADASSWNAYATLASCKAILKNAAGTTIATVGMPTTIGGATNIGTGLWKVTATITEAPARIEWEDTYMGAAKTNAHPVSVSFSWNGKITSGAVNQSNTPASGSSNPITSRNLSHAGTAVAVSNGNISFKVDAPPRVVDTLFPLASIRTWADLTNLQAEVSLTGGTPSLALVEASLLIEYDAQIYEAPAGAVTALIVASGANPADLIADLAAATGTALDVGRKRRFSAWCDAVGYRYARRLAEQEDALTLLTYALANAHVDLHPGPEGHRLVRWFDTSTRPWRIDEADLLELPAIGWADRLENIITLKYREAYAGEGFAGALVADPDNNDHCRRSLRQIRRQQPVTVEAKWIRDDATAAHYLADYARRYAPMRRTVSLSLPFPYAGIREGDLLLFRRGWFRVTAAPKGDNRITVAAEELI